MEATVKQPKASRTSRPALIRVSILDGNNCAASEIVTVNAFGCALTANPQASHVTCFGAADGAVSVSLVNATDPVQYHWSNGATGAVISGLAPGTYLVSILDGNGCEVVLSANVNSPALLSANATATAVTANGAQDGTASANPTGGTPGYGFLWSNGSTMQGIAGLAPGTYTVSVTDANGCSSVQTVNVTSFNCTLSLSVSSGSPSCFGLANGQATAVPSGGSLPYTFQWSTGASTQTITNLPAGNYTVTASDADGCEISQTITISQPDQLLATAANIQNVLCPGNNTGSATIVVTGGTGPYSYVPGGILTNLPVGNYAVTVTDARGCSTVANFSIVATDSEAPTMVCPAEISICGGNIVNYPSATAFDNCSLAGAPTLLSGPPSGAVFSEGITTIVFRASDTNGNVATCSFNIVVNWVPDILIDEIVNDVNGQGVGAISVTPVGSGGFTYAWNRNGQPFATTEDLTGLTAGAYTLTITDVNSCTSALAPIIITNSVSTYEPGQTGALRLWPNPAVAYIMLETVDMTIHAAQIFDLKGALVKTLTASDVAGEIQVGELPEGMYCLKAQLADGRSVSLRFVKR
jgi:HYR domain.